MNNDDAIQTLARAVRNLASGRTVSREDLAAIRELAGPGNDDPDPFGGDDPKPKSERGSGQKQGG